MVVQDSSQSGAVQRDDMSSVTESASLTRVRNGRVQRISYRRVVSDRCKSVEETNDGNTNHLSLSTAEWPELRAEPTTEVTTVGVEEEVMEVGLTCANQRGYVHNAGGRFAEAASRTR